MTVFEVLRGCKSPRREREALGLFSAFELVPVDLRAAAVAADLVRTNPGVFSAPGTLIDALVAASAVAWNATLVTLNTRQFARVRYPGLDVVLIDQDAADWAALVR